MSNPIYDITVQTIDGQDLPFSAFAGKVLLIVNTASQCGFTPQYAGLEKLHKDYAERGFSVLVFPYNQFGSQEPGTNAEIAAFCDTKYSVSFPLFARVDVNGANAHPLFEWLKDNARGVLGTESIKWNFTKFLVDKDGNVVARYASTTTPARIAEDMDRLLDA